VNLSVLLLVLRSREGRLHGREILVSLARVAAAAAVMGILLEGARRSLDLENARGFTGAVLVVAVILAGAGLYWVAARVVGAPEPAELAAVVRRRRA
jgi:peptidoglycan biosynthesis protein MviN/MurJ (putative lipid II flippase)